MIEGLSARRVESTPASDPTLGIASRQQQEQRGEKQSGAGYTGVSDTLSLSPEAREAVSKLQQRDREVRSHEQAHISAGGPHVSGGASYSYTRGPDGKQYAVGGSVSIDTASVPGNPEATLEKARMVRSAALAPGAPSAQDQSVAAQAASMEMQAQTEKRTQEQEEGGSGRIGLSGTDLGQDQDKSQGQPQGQPGSPLAVRSAQEAYSKQSTQGVQGIKPAERTDGAQAVGGPRAVDSVDAPAALDAASTVDPATGLRRADDSQAAAGQTPLAARTQSGSAGQNNGTLFGSMEAQARMDKVAAVYQAQQDKFIPITQLAPNGTGISITV